MPNQLQLSKLFFTLCLLVVLYISYRMLEPFLVPLILGLTLVSLFFPNYCKLDRQLGGRSNLSALLMVSAVTLLIVVPSMLFSLALFQELNDVYISFQNQLALQSAPGIWTYSPVAEEALLFLQENLGIDRAELAERFSAFLDRVAAFLLDHYSSILGGVGAFFFFFFQFFLMLFSMFFFFRDGQALLAELRRLIPLAPAHKSLVLDRLSEVTQATFLGIFATGICQGVAAGLIFFLLGISNPILWGTATAIFSLVPVVGTAAIWVPMSVYLILQGFYGRGILLLVLGSMVIGMVDNLLRPIIIGGRARGMHMLLVFLSLFGGLFFFGVSGLVLGPLLIALLVTFLEIYKLEFRKELAEAEGSAEGL